MSEGLGSTANMSGSEVASTMDDAVSSLGNLRTTAIAASIEVWSPEKRPVPRPSYRLSR